MDYTSCEICNVAKYSGWLIKLYQKIVVSETNDAFETPIISKIVNQKTMEILFVFLGYLHARVYSLITIWTNRIRCWLWALIKRTNCTVSIRNHQKYRPLPPVNIFYFQTRVVLTGGRYVREITHFLRCTKPSSTLGWVKSLNESYSPTTFLRSVCRRYIYDQQVSTKI